MDLIAFAAERDETLVELAELYEPAVEEALAEPEEDARTEILMVALAAAFLLMYGEEGGEEGSADLALVAFLDSMRGAVEMLVPDTSSEAAEAAQLDRMINWFATATLGAATLSAAQSNVAPGDSEPIKTWVTMRDDAVRDIHASLDGTTVNMTETFTVKSEPEAELLFPGQPVGPPAAWINCRCVLAIDMNPLVASSFREYDTTQRKEMADKGWALPDGSYPIADVEDLRNAIQAIGRASDPEAAKAHIRKRARDLDAEDLIPDTWSADTYAVGMVEEEVVEEEVVDEEEPPVPDELIPAEDENMPVYGVAAPEGVESGDGRSFLPGALTWRDLPLPLTWQRADIGEHNGKVVVGRLDSLERRDDGMVHWTGELLTDVAETEEVINLIAQGALSGVSIDADKGVQSMPSDAEMEEALSTGRMPSQEFSEARISGLTIVQIPAFQEAFISLGIDPEAPEPVAAAAEVKSYKRGSGWITHPEETNRIHNYWTKGKGAAKIRWGTNGDFTRCTRQLRKYIEPRFLNRTCAQWHHDALGYWPGELGKPGNPPDTPENRRRAARNASSLDPNCTDCEDTAMIAASADKDFPGMAPAISLVSAAPPALTDRRIFDDPKLDGPTALQIVGNHAFGHLATWGVCHIGIDRKCVTAPKSKSSYAHFHLGAIDTTEGELAVGTLTLGTGHADLNLSASSTSAHYDNTGTAVAKVRVGEDEHGIWFSGVVCDGVTDEQVRTLKAAGGLSGDWRSIGGNLELVAALAVNVPGFPVTRPALAASGEKQTALVAAGVVVHDEPVTADSIAAAVLAKIDERTERKVRLQNLESVKAAGRAKRLSNLTEV